MNITPLVLVASFLTLVTTSTPTVAEFAVSEVEECCSCECGQFDVIEIGRDKLDYVTYAEFDLMSAYVEIVAGDKGFATQEKVAEVIINRTLSDDYPDYIDEVIYQKGYRGLWKYIPNDIELYEVEVSDSVYEAVTDALYDPTNEELLNVGKLIK